MKVILGSQSRGRKAILERTGIDFEVMSADIDEKAIRFEEPEKLTLALANAKADALVKNIKEPAILVTSDQVVVADGKILEKPKDADEFREYAEIYKNHPAETVTAVVVTNTTSGKKVEGLDRARVWLNPLPEKVLNELIDEGDVFYRAGGFSIENPILKPFVKRIEGDEDSIMGLPLKLTIKLMDEIK